MEAPGPPLGLDAASCALQVPGIPGISPARKDGLTKNGNFAPGELQPGELSRMRDTMRKSYCAGGAHPDSISCQIAAHLAKVKAETDPAKKKAIMEARAAELKAHPLDKAATTKAFFAMFDGYCASGGETRICTNKQLLAAKAKNTMPVFGNPFAKPPAPKPA